jgi:hypothetical protein
MIFIFLASIETRKEKDKLNKKKYMKEIFSSKKNRAGKNCKVRSLRKNIKLNFKVQVGYPVRIK